MTSTPDPRHDTTPDHPLGPRPDPWTDPMLAACRRANVGAWLELERRTRPPVRPLREPEEPPLWDDEP